MTLENWSRYNYPTASDNVLKTIGAKLLGSYNFFSPMPSPDGTPALRRLVNQDLQSVRSTLVALLTEKEIEYGQKRDGDGNIAFDLPAQGNLRVTLWEYDPAIGAVRNMAGVPLAGSDFTATIVVLHRLTTDVTHFAETLAADIDVLFA